MPVLIVDALEVIEIEQQHGGGAAPVIAQLPSEDLTEVAAVEDPGDGVLAREALGLGMRLLQLAVGMLDALEGLRQLARALGGELEEPHRAGASCCAIRSRR